MNDDSTTGPPEPWVPDLRDRSCTEERVATIAFTPMAPRLRNELITQAYGDIAEAMGDLLGTDNATWTNLGLWASNSIGRYLAVPVPVVGSALSRPFADGNRDVFAEIGRAHVLFLDTVGRAQQSGEEIRPAWQTFRQRLMGFSVEPPGSEAGDTFALWDSVTDHPTRPRGKPNTRLLNLGFRAYARSLRLEDDDRARAILLGNILLALHEQRRLSIAISVGFRSWVRTLATLPRPLRTQFEWATRPPNRVSLHLENRWIRFATHRLVGIGTPDGSIRVSDPVPAGERPVTFDRVHLDRAVGIDRTMSDTEMLNQLYAALDVDGHPATCWNDHVQRMGYITGLFEQQQRSGSWFRSDGAVIRPDAWSRFDRRLDAHAAAIAAAPSVGTDLGLRSPVPDTVLDEMRSEPSHPALSDQALLTFDVIGDPDRRHELMGEIEADTARRLAVISADGAMLAPETVRRAQRLFRSWSSLMLMGLLFRALPHDYAAARGVRVLGAISSLGTDALRRAGETTHFVQELLARDEGWDNGAMVPGGTVFQSVVGVRCLHSIVSGHLRDAGWDDDELGVPVNQEDVFGTALSFVVPPLEMMRDLGADINEEDLDAYTRFWLGIGHLLGAPMHAVTLQEGPDAQRPLTYREAAGATSAIRRRHHARSLDGVRMTEALMSGVGDGFPRGFAWMSHGMVRAVGDPETSALLLAHVGPGRRRAAVLSGALRAGLAVPGLRIGTRWFVQRAGTRMLEPFMDAGHRRPYRHPARHMTGPRDIASTDLSVWPFGC